MVMAKLHIICGNCGCNDGFEYHIDPKGLDFGDRFEPAVYILCKNCSTLHRLDSVIPERTHNSKSTRPQKRGA